MTAISASLRLRPTRIGFLVDPNDLASPASNLPNLHLLVGRHIQSDHSRLQRHSGGLDRSTLSGAKPDGTRPGAYSSFRTRCLCRGSTWRSPQQIGLARTILILAMQGSSRSILISRQRARSRFSCRSEWTASISTRPCMTGSSNSFLGTNAELHSSRPIRQRLLLSKRHSAVFPWTGPASATVSGLCRRFRSRKACPERRELDQGHQGGVSAAIEFHDGKP